MPQRPLDDFSPLKTPKKFYWSAAKGRMAQHFMEGEVLVWYQAEPLPFKTGADQSGRLWREIYWRLLLILFFAEAVTLSVVFLSTQKDAFVEDALIVGVPTAVIFCMVWVGCYVIDCQYRWHYGLSTHALYCLYGKEVKRYDLEAIKALHAEGYEDHSSKRRNEGYLKFEYAPPDGSPTSDRFNYIVSPKTLLETVQAQQALLADA